MLRSMTGFGRSEVSRDGWNVRVEMKSVNHRYLDLFIRLPKSFLALEERIREETSALIARGRVEIYLTIEELAEKKRMVKIDRGLLQGFLEEWQTLRQEIPGIPEVSFEQLMRLPDLIQFPEPVIDVALLGDIVSEALHDAIAQVNEMRQREGTKLTEDILEKLRTISGLVQRIEGLAPEVVDIYRQRLRERMDELLKGTSLSEERFQAEVALFADRCSIDEEIVRLHSHIQQFHQSLHQDNSIGRKLDFLIQEMNREVNTIGSKASSGEIASLVVELKSEIEKLREQIQNVE